MKKYLNKGLLYAWFNSAKAPIGIGIFVWGIIANILIKRNLSMVKNEIANNFNNYYPTTGLYEYIMLGVIFIGIYSMAKGINKRNTEMFLSSGPYTKKQIKYNELINLLFTLILFVITYAYIAIMSYISNRELLYIVDGYQTIILIEILKIVLFGIIGIVLMLIIDSMFSNSVIGFMSMISILPFSIFIIFMKMINILRYFGVGDNYSLLDKIELVNPNEEFRRYSTILIDEVTVKDITFNNLTIEIVVTAMLIVLLIIIYNIVQRKFKLENCNKIFSSNINENIIITIVSTGVGCFGAFILLESYINSLQHKNGGPALLGENLLKAVGADIVCIAVIALVVYKILKKIIRNFV